MKKGSIERVQEAIDHLIHPDDCTLEEALERLEEVQDIVDIQIDCIHQDLARRDGTH